MKCFYHNQSDAVGTCKYCCKGLCPNCAKDSGAGLACVNKCEDKVKLLSETMEKTAKIQKGQASLYLRQAILMFVTGPMIFAFGYFYHQDLYEWISYVFVAVGVIQFQYFRNFRKLK
jgi:hypothetical protein